MRKVEREEAVDDSGFVSELSSRGKPTRRYEAGGESPLVPRGLGREVCDAKYIFLFARGKLDPWISRPGNGPESFRDPKLPKVA